MPRPPRPLPLVGHVAAGVPILAEQNVEEYVDVPALLRRGDDDFLLRVHGDSMADAGIYNGDYIVVHQQHRRERRHRGRPGGRRSYHQALLPRGRPHPPAAGERALRADRRTTMSRSSAQSWGCCEDYELVAVAAARAVAGRRGDELAVLVRNQAGGSCAWCGRPTSGSAAARVAAAPATARTAATAAPSSLTDGLPRGAGGHDDDRAAQASRRPLQAAVAAARSGGPDAQTVPPQRRRPAAAAAACAASADWRCSRGPGRRSGREPASPTPRRLRT